MKRTFSAKPLIVVSKPTRIRNPGNDKSLTSYDFHFNGFFNGQLITNVSATYGYYESMDITLGQDVMFYCKVLDVMPMEEWDGKGSQPYELIVDVIKYKILDESNL